MNAVTYIQIALGNFNIIHRPALLRASMAEQYKLLYNIVPAERTFIINNKLLAINRKIYLNHFLQLDFLNRNGSRILDTPGIVAEYMSINILINKSKQLN